MGNCQKEQQADDKVPRHGPIQEMYKIFKVDVLQTMFGQKITKGYSTTNQQRLRRFKQRSRSMDIQVRKIPLLSFIKQLSSFQSISNPSHNKILRNSMFQMTKKENFYQINPIYLEDDNYTFQKMLWLVVKSIPQKFYELRQKDVIKLGKQKVRVRQLVVFDENPSMIIDFDNISVSKPIYSDITSKKQEQFQKTKNFLSIEPSTKKALSEVTTSEAACRICLEIGQTTNPLITPCKCIGSVKYIHLKCLRIWLGKRLQQSKSSCCITINWQPLTCEMCKSPFKYRIYMDNKKFYSVQIPKPPKPYVVLEVLRKNDGTNGKLFHFVSLSQKTKVGLGRKKDIDVKISDDISVSRNHAFIEYRETNKSFVLMDNNSKFGSLIMIKKCLQVRPIHSGISFQVGAEVFSCESIRSKGGEEQKNLSSQYFPDEIDEDNEEEVDEVDEQNSSQQIVNQEQNNQQLADLRSPGISQN